eukprot:1091033-Pelagomonas_calceolata.AAC.2
MQGVSSLPTRFFLLFSISTCMGFPLSRGQESQVHIYATPRAVAHAYTITHTPFVLGTPPDLAPCSSGAALGPRSQSGPYALGRYVGLHQHLPAAQHRPTQEPRSAHRLCHCIKRAVPHRGLQRVAHSQVLSSDHSEGAAPGGVKQLCDASLLEPCVCVMGVGATLPLGKQETLRTGTQA